MRKVIFYTLGCKLNFSESSTLGRAFCKAGFELFSRADHSLEPVEQRADVCVINTCSVTSEADKKCRNMIRRAGRENPGTLVVVTGCYAQLKPTEIQELASVEGVACIVVGNDQKGRVVELVVEHFNNFNKLNALSTSLLSNTVAEIDGGVAGATAVSGETGQEGYFPAFSVNDRTRAFLKVQDGCNYHCAYCTIPKARGESRNQPIAEIVEQAQEIAYNGMCEIVLTGVNIGDFGRSTGERFIDLLRALDAVDGIQRYRISSIEPNLLTDEILDFCAGSSKFQPHFHIPLQAGSDNVLALMRRRYNTTVYAERINAVRQRMPDAFIGIDIIVGFPGETIEDFDATCHFLETVRPAFLHIFPYSERPDTPAIEFSGKVFAQERSRRVKVLGELCETLHSEFCRRFQGADDTVLFETGLGAKHQFMHGYTRHYVKVEYPYNDELTDKLVDVKLTTYCPERGTMNCQVKS